VPRFCPEFPLISTAPSAVAASGISSRSPQVFGSEPASRLEQVGDEHSERMQDRKHRLK